MSVKRISLEAPWGQVLDKVTKKKNKSKQAVVEAAVPAPAAEVKPKKEKKAKATEAPIVPQVTIF